MVSPRNKFIKLIQKDHEVRSSELWSGSFLDYLDLIQKMPETVKLAHNHLYNVVMTSGIHSPNEQEQSRLRKVYGDHPPKVYNFFKDVFYGIEDVIEKIIHYLHAASLKGEESRQVLYLMGPVGAGKSSLVELLKFGLENAEPVFVIEGCPIHEEPLHLIPRHLREEFSDILGTPIEGELCPICRHRLKENYDNKYEDMPVSSMKFSIVDRQGVAVVPPVDPNNQDTSVLIGSEDISKLDRYSEGDPRVLDLNGAFNIGNRGMIEFIEIFKNETEYLHAIITATQEKIVPAPGRHGTVYTDAVIIGHSNEAEWKKFKSDHTNEAILDRIVVIKIPYNLRLNDEKRIYQKILSRSGFDAHIAPHTIEVAAMFSILSRLEVSNKCDLITKMKLYNGEEVVEKGATKKIDVQELKEDTKAEGMNGISPRFIMKALDKTLSQSPEGITPIHIREVLIRMIKESEYSDDMRKKYLEFLQDTIHKAYLDILEKEITKAFVFAYEEQAESLFQNYLDHAEAFVNKSTLKNQTTLEELQPDKEFLKSIEEQIGITGTATDGFRQEVISYLWAMGRRGESVSYKSYEPLKDAIEKKLMGSVREISRIITKSRTRDEDQVEKYDALVESMISNGYNEFSAEVVLKYAANHLWKD